MFRGLAYLSWSISIVSSFLFYFLSLVVIVVWFYSDKEVFFRGLLVNNFRVNLQAV